MHRDGAQRRRRRPVRKPATAGYSAGRRRTRHPARSYLNLHQNLFSAVTFRGLTATRLAGGHALCLGTKRLVAASCLYVKSHARDPAKVAAILPPSFFCSSRSRIRPMNRRFGQALPADVSSRHDKPPQARPSLSVYHLPPSGGESGGTQHQENSSKMSEKH